MNRVDFQQVISPAQPQLHRSEQITTHHVKAQCQRLSQVRQPTQAPWTAQLHPMGQRLEGGIPSKQMVEYRQRRPQEANGKGKGKSTRFASIFPTTV